MPAAAREARTRWAVQPARADEMRLGEVDGADTEVVLGIDETLGGGGLGLFEQTVRRVTAVARGLDDPFGGTQHGGLALEPGLAGVQLAPGIDGDEATGGVQNVGDRTEARVGVPDRVAEHRSNPLFGGEADGAGGEPQGPGAGALAAVPDGFEAQGVAVDLPPGREQLRGAVGAPRGECAADVGGGAEQYGQSFGVVVRPEQQGLPPRAAVGTAARVRRRDDSAEVGPAGRAVPGEEGHPGSRLVDEGTTTDRGAAPLPSYGLPGPSYEFPGRSGGSRARRRGGPGRPGEGPRRPGGRPRLSDGSLDRELRPEQRTDTRLRAGLGEPDRAREAVPVGEREGVHAPLRGTLGQPLRVRGPVPQGEPGDGVQMREPRHTHLPYPSVSVRVRGPSKQALEHSFPMTSPPP